MRIVLCTCPAQNASELAEHLVEERFAGCVNIVPSVESVYWWEGLVRHTDESLLIIKTRAALLPVLTEAIKNAHPHEVPEVIALPIQPGEGNPEYLKWLTDETSDDE